MKKLGIAVNELGLSQCNFFLINNLNKISSTVACALFHHKWEKPPMPALFGTFQENEMWDFDGVLITTNIDSTQKSIVSPGPRQKYFYVWDFEWMDYSEISFKQLQNIYLQKDIHLIARSETHARILENNFKKPKYIMEDWDINILEKIINEV